MCTLWRHQRAAINAFLAVGVKALRRPHKSKSMKRSLQKRTVRQLKSRIVLISESPACIVATSVVLPPWPKQSWQKATDHCRARKKATSGILNRRPRGLLVHRAGARLVTGGQTMACRGLRSAFGVISTPRGQVHWKLLLMLKFVRIASTCIFDKMMFLNIHWIANQYRSSYLHTSGALCHERLSS
jgi:hypothetical protein